MQGVRKQHPKPTYQAIDMSAALPINDTFPSPEELAEKQAKNIKEYWVDNQESLPIIKDWIREEHALTKDPEKRKKWSKTARLLLGGENMEKELLSVRKSHEVNMKALLELIELKDINKIFFEAIKGQYPTEYMQIGNLFGIAKDTVKPKFFKEL